MTEPTSETKKPEPEYSEFIETVKLSPEEETARKRRNLMIALGLTAFAVLIAVTTAVRFAGNYNTGA
jgi:hypothetical protein